MRFGQTTGTRVACDRCDHGLRGRAACRAVTTGAPGFVELASRHLFEVGTGAETTSGAPEHRYPAVVVGLEVSEDTGESGAGGAIERIASRIFGANREVV